MLRSSFLFRCSSLPTTKKIIRVGDMYSIRRRFTREDVATFAKLCGDENPIHLSDEAAQKAGFSRAIVHGQLVGSLFSYIMGCHLPGPNSIYVHQSFRFLAPVLVDDEVEATITIKKFRRDKGLIMSDTTVKRMSDGKVAISGEGLGKNMTVDLQGDTPAW